MTVPPSVILKPLLGESLANATDQLHVASAVYVPGADLRTFIGAAWDKPVRCKIGKAGGVFLSRNMTSDPARCRIVISEDAALRGVICEQGDLSGITVAAGESVSERIEQAKAAIASNTETPLSRFSHALEHWKGLLAPHHYDALVCHLDRLLSEEEELEDEGIAPSIGSFEDLLIFLAARPWAKAPALGMTKVGQFAASWSQHQPTRDVSVTFLGDGAVKWYAYGLGKRSKGSVAGTGDRFDLPALLSRMGCDDWLVE